MVKTQDLLTQQLERIDFTKREEIVKLLPIYKQLQLNARKPLPKGVNIPEYTMKTPYGDQILLSGTELIIEPNRRQCLVGPNSSGKTLLFNNMVNANIEGFPAHLHVHHCRELELNELGNTVIDTVINSHPYLNTLLRIETKLKTLLSSEITDKKIADAYKGNLDLIASQINAIGGHQAEDKASKMLRVLGFDDIGQKKLVSSLSGGLKMRVALCMAFFIEADLLLLDEPTNHLDFPSVLWLENRLRGYKGSFILVSHDRELLKNVCTSVALIEDKMIKYYNSGFLEFEKKKTLEDKKKYEEIEKFLKKNENANPHTQIGRQRLDKKNWSDAYHAKLVALQCKFTFPAPVALTIPPGEDPNTKPENISIINLKNVRFSYDVSTGHYIFNEPISFNVLQSTRVGVMGPNGAGKSTFLKLLTHKLIANEGTVTPHPDFKLAYFGQHSTAELNMEATPMSFMQESFPKVNVGQLRNHLGKTGIVGNVADTRISDLSYSARSCTVFAKLTLACPHLLIMDEPTNFLDLESVDSLISACNKYKGALLLVSHNRDFLRKCARQYLSIVPGRFELYDDLKTAEKATYTFIQEMEEGGKVGGKDVLLNNPGGGTVHSSQKVDVTPAKPITNSPAPTPVAATIPADAPTKVVEIAPATTTTTTVSSESSKIVAEQKSTENVVGSSSSSPAAQNGESEYAVGEKCQARYSADGRWYNVIVRDYQSGKYQVFYVDYGNTEFLPVSSLRRAAAKPPAAAARKTGGNNPNYKGQPRHQNNNGKH